MDLEEKKKRTAGMSKYDLDTPCLVIDEDILDSNIRKMQDFVSSRGKGLRPHAKTHKCVSIIRKQIEAGCIGICTAKVSEAKVCIEQGIRDILITSPVITPRKIERLIKCVKKAPDCIIVVDSQDNAHALNDAFSSGDFRCNVLVGIDPGMGRTGISFDRAYELGNIIHSLDNLNLKGIQCYAGFLQHIKDYEERKQTSLEVMEKAGETVRRFRNEDLPCDIFTGGGTGSYEFDCSVQDVTDIQAGSYALMDAEYVNIGSAGDKERFNEFPPALTLLSTVISANRDGWVTADAGLKTLYHHGASPEILYPEELRSAEYEWFGDEHGKILIDSSIPRPDPGTVLELMVSHCDPTVNLFDEIYVTRNRTVTDIWPVDMRGKSQ